ncbi:MAG: SAM-dependent methyltransferase, partial [Methylocystis sp.]
MNDKRLFAPSTARNRGPILDVLRNVLPAKGVALEIASGAGEHVTFFAEHMSGLTFCPSDPNAEARESISAWIAFTRLANVKAPLALNVEEFPWPINAADAIICINMTHISPWSATEALFEGGVRTLSAGAPLYLYGPYKRGGAHTAPSNAEFDASLRARNAAWGIRDLEDVAACARAKGFGEPQ